MCQRGLAVVFGRFMIGGFIVAVIASDTLDFYDNRGCAYAYHHVAKMEVAVHCAEIE